MTGAAHVLFGAQFSITLERRAVRDLLARRRLRCLHRKRPDALPVPHPRHPDAATWARLSPLLDEALDLPLPDRAAWLVALQALAPQDAAAAAAAA